LVQNCTCGRFRTVTFETVSLFFPYIYLRIPSYLGPRGEPPFFQTGIFCCSIQRFYTNSHKSLILFYGSFLNFGTNSYKLIHTIIFTNCIVRIRTAYNCYTNCIVRIRTRCGFCTNSYNFYTNCIVRIRTRCGFCTNSDKILCELYRTNSYNLPTHAARNKLFGDTK